MSGWPSNKSLSMTPDPPPIIAVATAVAASNVAGLRRYAAGTIAVTLGESTRLDIKLSNTK